MKAIRESLAPAWICTVLMLVAMLQPAAAQQLTAEQLDLINQLPPAQREQALNALRGMNVQQAGGELQPISETGDAATAGSQPQPMPIQLESEPELRAGTGSRLVITFTEKPQLSVQESRGLESDPALRRLRGSHVFVLDDTGALSLPGLEKVQLLGLTEDDILRRLSAESYLDSFNLGIRILDVQPTGVEALKPFGYDLFTADETGFDAPVTGPVPADYVLGPGDAIRIQLFGNTNGIYEYDVTRDGILNLPEIGPVTVAGIPFSEFRQDVNARVQEMLIGTQVSVTMGQLRTVRVFVLGDVNRPGSYVVGGLATISSTLYRSGGISEVGSLRQVQLKRSGQTVTTLDLYDLLLSGDTSNDRRLQPGDVIFVPPIGETIGVSGAVRRPAIYEIDGKATLADAVELAGGLAPDAFGGAARLERIDASQERRVISLDLADSRASQTQVRTGDILYVPQVLPDFEETIVLSGHVQRPGPYEWRDGMRLADLISSSDELLEGADTDYIIIRRQPARASPVDVLSANLGSALSDRASAENVRLESRDEIHVFSLAYGRQRVIVPILEELNRQATFEAPYRRVDIAGNVRAPGTYPFESGMRVSDLIRAGGNLTERAYTLEAELTRYSVNSGEERATELIRIDLASVLRGDRTADLVLTEHDHIRISTVPDWQSEWSVVLEGEVRFPGEFRIRRGETLRQVVDRAGGVSDEAFPEGAIFLRQSLREQEQQQMQMLARRIEADLASLSLETMDSANSETLSTGRVLLSQLKNTEAVGRLVISPELLSSATSVGTESMDVELMDGDRLMVPRRSQVVTVIGEVQQSTSHLYQEGLIRDDYIEMSGGETRRADKAMIYVVRASGAVIAANRSNWFGRSSRVEIRPGDTIVVPFETGRVRPLTLWTSITQILYQAAIAVAAVRTFDN